MWQIFRDRHRLRGLLVYIPHAVLLPEGFVEPQAQLDPQAFLAALRGQLEAVLLQVADAVNQAPPGSVITHSEEEVRDLLADFRRRAYQAAVQMRLDAAEAASPPSAGPQDR